MHTPSTSAGKLLYMQFTHRYKTALPEFARAAEHSVGAIFYPYRVFSEGYAGVLEARARFVEGLLEAGRSLVEGAGQQQSIAAEAYTDLFWAPFRVYGGVASSDELGEDGMSGESDIREEDRMMVLTDGTCVPVRKIRPEDASALQRLVGRLSERTVQLRYFGPMKELSNKQAHHFAEVDGVNRCALVALDPEDEDEIVAVVRYDQETGTDKAEYAALVEDRFQGRGLGIGLTRALIEAARERGVKAFEALVMPQNKGMIHLLQSLDLLESVRWENGVKHFSINLFPKRAEDC